MKSNKKIIEVIGYIKSDQSDYYLANDNKTSFGSPDPDKAKLNTIIDEVVSSDKESKLQQHEIDHIKLPGSDGVKQDEQHDAISTINELVKAYITFVQEKNKLLKQTE